MRMVRAKRCWAQERSCDGKEWVRAHQGRWVGWVRENGLREGTVEANDWDFIAFVMTVESDRQFDIEKAKEMGFAEEIEKSQILKGYETAFERMRTAKMIP
jgi:phage anti-repressor protein